MRRLDRLLLALGAKPPVPRLRPVLVFHRHARNPLGAPRARPPRALGVLVQPEPQLLDLCIRRKIHTGGVHAAVGVPGRDAVHKLRIIPGGLVHVFIRGEEVVVDAPGQAARVLALVAEHGVGWGCEKAVAAAVWRKRARRGRDDGLVHFARDVLSWDLRVVF